jgi:hypothetical protein
MGDVVRIAVVDPHKVEFECRAQPWFTPPARWTDQPKIGSVPQAMRQMYEHIPDSPPFSGVRGEYKRAEDAAVKIYRAQILEQLKLSTIKEDCASEPWSNKPVEHVASAKFGYMPEKYLAASMFFTACEDSVMARQYADAYTKADKIYWQQMKEAAIRFAEGKARKDVEPMCQTLWLMCKDLEKTHEGDGERPDLAARFLWMADAVGYVQQGLHANRALRTEAEARMKARDLREESRFIPDLHSDKPRPEPLVSSFMSSSRFRRQPVIPLRAVGRSLKAQPLFSDPGLNND